MGCYVSVALWGRNMDEQSVTPQQPGSNVPPSQPVQPMTQSTYAIYLLTVWFSEGENASDPAHWRFRLENPRTKESKGFVGVDALMAGLIETIGKRDNDLQREQERNKP